MHNSPSSTILAVVGDVHGHHKQMLSLLHAWETRSSRTIDLVLQVGDFEPHRDPEDLTSMSAPSKYKQPGDFHLLHTQQLSLPWPLYFIGGNHEPHGFLEQFPQGAQLLHNCHYLGRTGGVEALGIKIAGISGIYLEQSTQLQRPALSSLSKHSNRDFIHMTEQDVWELLDLAPIDLLLLHDWPAGVIESLPTQNVKSSSNRVFRRESGNPLTRTLIQLLKPRLVFCGHMHTAHRTTWSWEDGRQTNIICLGHISQGQEAFAVYEVSEREPLRFKRLHPPDS